MPFLSFTVRPSQLGQLHDILSCLLKFDENISLAASSNSVSLVQLETLFYAHFRSSAFLVSTPPNPLMLALP